MNRLHRNLFVLAFIGVFVCLGSVLSDATYASEERSAQRGEQPHAEGAAEHHEETLFQKIGKWFNFLALATIVYLFVTKTLRVPEKFKAGAAEIERAVESARLAKEEAEQRLRKLDQRMMEMNDDIARIKAQASTAAEEEKRRILEAAQREAERIVEIAHRTVEAEVRLAQKELRRHVAEIAVKDSRTIVREEIDEEDHQRLINNYIDEFGK